MAKKKPKQKTAKSPSIVRTPSIVPQPPPRLIVKETSRKPGIGARTKAQIRQLKDALDNKETKASHVAAGAAGTVGCTLAGAYMVGKGWLTPKWASALLTTLGAGATFAGWYYDQPLVMWGGA